jgi:hypothetical protein
MPAALRLAAAVPALIAAGAWTCLAQPAPPVVTLADLRTPTSPAFTLLGIAPTDVERPSTPRAFTVSLLSALRDGNGSLLPRDFALEVAPYWLVQRPGLRFDDYANPSPAQSLRQTFSVSVAATRASDEEIARLGDATSIGVGVRASPLAGRTTPELAALVAGLRLAHTRALVLQDLLDASADPTAPLPEAIAKTLAELAGAEVDDPAAHARMLQEIEAALVTALAADTPDARARVVLRQMAAEADARISRLALQVQGANQRRVGWVVDVAGGFVVRSLVGDTSETDVTRGGAWVSAGYSGAVTHGLLLARVLKNRADPATAETTIDAGGKVTHIIDRLTVGGEVLWRFDRSPVKRSSSTTRAVATVEYEVNDDIRIRSTFGRDYGNTTLGLDGVTVAILGVDVQLGALPKLKLP